MVTDPSFDKAKVLHQLYCGRGYTLKTGLLDSYVRIGIESPSNELSIPLSVAEARSLRNFLTLCLRDLGVEGDLPPVPSEESK